MKNNKGFTLNELIGIIALLAIIGLIATPIILNIVNETREKNRQNKIRTFAKEIYGAYTLTITENPFYAFDSEEKGGLTENNTINFTNAWLQENVNVLGVDCSGENNYSTVFFDLYQEKVTLTECLVDGVNKYSFINEEITKK